MTHLETLLAAPPTAANSSNADDYMLGPSIRRLCSIDMH